MTPLCSVEDHCLHFFPGMGFRPAVHEVQRNQYGDQTVLVVGDDSLMQGKIPPGTNNFALGVDVYAPLQGRDSGILTSALSGPGSVPFVSVPGVVWTGGGSSGGSSPPPVVTDTKPTVPDTSPEPPGTQPDNPDTTPPGTTPPDDTSQEETPPETTPPPPDITPPGTPLIEVPDIPELPPMLPVPLPDAAPLLIAALLALAILRRRTA